MKIASYLCKALTCLLLLASVNALKATEGFSLIRAGSFTMGNGVAEDTDIKDAPARTVTLDAFYIGKCEVTRAEWDDVRNWGLKKGYVDLPIGGESTNDPRNPSNYPAYYISWYAAVKWCNARSEKESLTPVYYTDNGKTTVYKEGDVNVTNLQVKWTANGYRLPTEAEWEKAARGKLSGMRFPRGDTISHDEANYSASNIIYDITGVKVNDKPIVEGPPKKYTTPPPSAEMPKPKPYPEPHTSPISSFPPNAYESYDMAGNVYEWCWDWYGLYDGLPDLNPRGPELNESLKNERVYRGGAYADTAKQCRVANREQTSPSYKTSKLIGFRVARTAIGINGIVKYQDKPLEGIAVTAHRYDPNGDSSDSLDSATTDEFGKYSLVGLDPGAYRIRFDPGADNPILSNLAPQYYNNAPSLGLAQDVVLTSSESVSGINAVLTEASKITGKIVSALDEAPIEKVMVRAFRKRDDNGEWDRSSWVNFALSRSDGTYDLNLPEGAYLLEFYADENKYEFKAIETPILISRSAPITINESLRLTQTISAFAPIDNKMYGDPVFTVIAPTAKSGLPVTLSIKSGPAEISGNTVTITGVGTVVIAANQAGDAIYNAASEVTTSFMVSKGTPSITTKPVASAITFGQKLSLATLTGGAGSVPGTFAFVTPDATPSVGTADQSVIFTPTDSVNQSSVTTTIGVTVNKAIQTIDAFAFIGNKAYGDGWIEIIAPESSSGLAVIPSVKSGPAELGPQTTSGNTKKIIVKFNGVGPVVLAANQAGDANYLPAEEVTVIFAVLDMKSMAGDFIGNYDSQSQTSQGAYDGNGQLAVKLSKGSFSGSLVISGSRVAVKGKFDPEGKASVAIKNKTLGNISLALSIEPMTASELKIQSTLNRADGNAKTFDCYPVAFTGKGRDQNFPLGVKQINSLLESQAASDIEFGHGFVMIKTSNDGILKFTGRAADGSAITGATRLVKDAIGDILAPVSFPLSAVKGLLHGVAEINANPQEGQYYLSSPSEWIWVRVPQTKAKTFKAGFAEKLNVYGQVWSFTKGQSALPEAEGGFTFQVDPDSVLLEEPLELNGSWPISNKPLWDAPPAKGFTFKVNTATGQISGTAPRTIDGKAAKALSYQGLLVKPGLDISDDVTLMGGGYLLGTESSGVVELNTP